MKLKAPANMEAASVCCHFDTVIGLPFAELRRRANKDGCVAPLRLNCIKKVTSLAWMEPNWLRWNVRLACPVRCGVLAAFDNLL